MRRPPWLKSGLVLVAVGWLAGSPWLLELGVLVLAVGGLARAWSHFALSRIRYERVLSHRRVFAGESVALTLRLANDKLLPLAWLVATDEVPVGLVLAGTNLTAASSPQRRLLQHRASLRPYERVSWHLSIDCPRRGIYRFGPLRLESGDIFGLFEESREDPATQELVVFPAVRALPALGFPAGEPFGGKRASQPLFQDPLRPVGVRDFRPEDSRRRVNWKATARAGALRVNELEAVNDQTVVIALNVATFEQSWIGVDPALQETLVVVAASLAADAAARDLAVGLVANSAGPGSGWTIRVPAGRDPEVLSSILTALAAVSAFVSLPFERLLATASRNAPWGSTLVVVSALWPEAVLVELVRLRRAGRRITMVSLAEAPPAAVPGVTSFHLPATALDFGRRAA